MDQFQIQTAQNVRIDQPIAFFGERLAAYLIDLFIKVAYVIVLVWLSVQLEAESYLQNWVFGLLMFLPYGLYSLVLEALNNGQTIGKSLMSIRVVRLDGSKPDFANYLIRWSLRIFDIIMSSGAVAVLVILFGGKGQRLGDVAGGTTVISEKRRMVAGRGLLMEDLPEGYKPTFPQVTVLSDADMITIRRVYYDALSRGKYELIRELEKKIVEITGIQHEMDPVEFIRTVILDYMYLTSR